MATVSPATLFTGLPRPAHTHAQAVEGLPPYPEQDTVTRLHALPEPDGWQPGGRGVDVYLDLAERIVRAAADWRNDDGATIDPVTGHAHGQTSPRFASPACVLLYFGRCEDLAPKVWQSLDWCCRRLASGEASSPDFWMRELTTALMCVAHIAPPDRLAQWHRDIKAVEPERVYKQVRPNGDDLHKLHNWTLYAAAGEAMRERMGLCDHANRFVQGEAFWRKYVPPQLGHITSHGMYRDPGDPFTYDMTTRLQLAYGLTASGDLDNRANAQLFELLRRGALSQLLYLTPPGYAPYGGRSAAFHFQEAITAAVCEWEAARYAESDTELAGVFKRQAYLAANSVRRWLDQPMPFTHLKNRFHPDREFGIDGYGVYSVYSLLCASLFGLAALMSDDRIAQRPAFFERREARWSLVLQPAFHKVFATVGDTQMQIDTHADANHDATGLGRFTRAGAPIELGPGMAITATPKFKLPEDVIADQPASIDIGWRRNGQWQQLADAKQGDDWQCETDCEDTPRGINTTLRYRSESVSVTITHRYQLSAGHLQIRSHVTADADANAIDVVRFTLPILADNGADQPDVQLADTHASVTLEGATWRANWPEGAAVTWRDRPAANRHGVYRVFVLEQPGDRFEIDLHLEAP